MISSGSCGWFWRGVVCDSVCETGFEKPNNKGGGTVIGSCKNVPDCGYGHNSGWCSNG